MFGFGKKETVSPAVAVEEVPRGEIPKLSEGLRAQVKKYQEVAQRIRFVPGNLMAECVTIFCADNQIPIYDLDRVSDFLDRKAAADRKANGMWAWVPLRKEDSGKLSRPGHSNKHARKESAVRRYDDVGKIMIERGYHGLIPMPILDRVEKIQKAFPELNFFVSDISPNSDPFIAVSGVGFNMIVFGQWNEPDFE